MFPILFLSKYDKYFSDNNVAHALILLGVYIFMLRMKSCELPVFMSLSCAGWSCISVVNT